MDLNDYWQDNKRFVVTVGGGVLAFLVGQMLIGSFLGDELAARQREVRSAASELRKPRYGSSELAQARAENEALEGVMQTLQREVVFEPRPEFVLDPGRGSPTNQYFARVQEVRERLLREAGRRRLKFADERFGLPQLAPTREEDIARHLEGLDLVERVCDVALEAGVARIERTAIELDRGFDFARRQARSERRVAAPIETTRVTMKLSGPSAPLVRLLAATQDKRRGSVLLIEELSMKPVAGKSDQAELEVVFGIVRLRPGAEED